MLTLEIVRLSIINWGVTLLPLVYVGLLLSAYLHFSKGFSNRIPQWEYLNIIVLFGGGIITSVVKIIGLAKPGKMGDVGREKYLVMDQITDVAVVAGIYAVLGVLEGVLSILRRRREGMLEKGGSLRIASMDAA